MKTEIKPFTIGKVRVNSAKPEKFRIQDDLKKELISFIKSLEEKYNNIVINRVRFDLAFTKKGVFMYELNAKNPLGLIINSQMFRYWGFEKESLKIEKVILSIFEKKIPILAVDRKNDFFNSEISGLERIFRKNSIEYKKIFYDDNEIKKYVDNTKYCIWYSGTLDESKIPENFFGANNIYGGKIIVGNKSILTSKNFPQSKLIAPKSQIKKNVQKYIVPKGMVAKITEGELSHGGKGIFFENEEISEAKKILLQERLYPDFDLDVIVLKVGKEYVFFAFRRIAAENTLMANVSQGGAYKPLIIIWLKYTKVVIFIATFFV